MEDYDFRSAFNEKYSINVKKIIRMLSENSRVSITEMARQLGVSRKTVENKIKKAEKEFGIKYTIELEEAALGLDNPHLILIKFIEKPDYNKIKEILTKSHIPQLAVTLNGTYDMFVYANAEDPNEYVYWDKTTQVLLSEYKASWQASDIAFKHLGFFPIRTVLIERLKIPKVYKDMLLLLNENSRMSFSEMSRRLGMKSNTLAYNFMKLKKMGYVKRFTIIITKPPELTMTSLFGKYIIVKGFEDDSMSMRKEITFMDDKIPLISRCLFSVQLVGSFDFFFVAAYDNANIGYSRLIKYYKQRYKKHGVKAMYGTIDKTLVGDFPTRNLDSKKEFNMIRWIPGIKPKVEKSDKLQ
jgi:DNA-binding Lrp family transcriptional regulator